MKYKDVLKLVREERELFRINSLKFSARQRGERCVPHFHFETKDKSRKGAIMIDAPKYYKHDDYIGELKKEEKIFLVKWCKDWRNWYKMAKEWNDSVKEGNKINLPEPNSQENIEKIIAMIPDYALL